MARQPAPPGLVGPGAGGRSLAPPRSRHIRGPTRGCRPGYRRDLLSTALVSKPEGASPTPQACPTCAWAAPPSLVCLGDPLCPCVPPLPLLRRWVPFVCELAVMVVRSRDGSLASFPVVQTIHKDSICWTTETPARVPAAAQQAAQAVAEQAVATLEGERLAGWWAGCVRMLRQMRNCQLPARPCRPAPLVPLPSSPIPKQVQARACLAWRPSCCPTARCC